MERFLVENGGDAISAKEAFDRLVQKVGVDGDEAAILVASVAAIDNLAGLLTGAQVAEAKKDRKVRVAGVPVSIFTPKTGPGHFDGSVFIPWTDTGLVEKAEGLSPKLVCATGWSQTDLEVWKATWNPVDLSTGERVGVEPPGDRLVEAIVGQITHPSGGNSVSSTSDKRKAVEGFKALYVLGIEFDPEEARAVALRSGWKADAAERLHGIARKIKEGKTVQGAGTIGVTKAKEIVTRLEAWKPL
jgi:hypothetical protein